MNDRREEIASIMRELCVTLTLYRVPPSLLLPILNNAIETVRRETGLHYDTLIIDEAQVLNRRYVSCCRCVCLASRTFSFLTYMTSFHMRIQLDEDSFIVRERAASSGDVHCSWTGSEHFSSGLSQHYPLCGHCNEALLRRCPRCEMEAQ